MFRFSIRDLMLVTLVAAVVVYWIIDHSRLAVEIERLKNPYSALLDEIKTLPEESRSHVYTSEELRKIRQDWERHWSLDKPTHLSKEIEVDNARPRD